MSESLVKFADFKTYPPEYVELSTLVLDHDNANNHTEADLAPTGKSLAAFGQVETICADKATRRVIGGNGRVLKMREQGITHAWVIFVEGTEPQLRTLAIALNQTGRNSDFNWEVLTRQLQFLDTVQTQDQPFLELTAIPLHLLEPALAAEHLMPELGSDVGLLEDDGGAAPTPAGQSRASGKLASRGLSLQFTLAQRTLMEEVQLLYCEDETIGEMLFSLVKDKYTELTGKEYADGQDD